MKRKIIVLLSFAILMGLNVNAATITAPLEEPTVGAWDIAQLNYSDSDTANVVGDGNDEWVYVADDRETHGQTFTLSAGAKLEGIWVKHVNYGSWTRFVPGHTAVVRVSSVSGSALTVLHSETGTVADGADNTFHDGGGNGTGRWIHIALDTPVLLPGAGTYAFDLTAPVGSQFCIELAGVNNNPYAGGMAYNTADNTKLGMEIARPHVDGDRTFILNLAPSKVSPVTPAPGAVNVPLEEVLSWQVLDINVTSIDLYFSTDANLPAGSRILTGEPAATTSLDPGFLDYDTPYYWRIDAYEPNTLGGPDIKTVGSAWSFRTVGQSAAVSAVSPAKTVVDPGTPSRQLSVTAVNATSYQWYKVGTPDAALTDGADYAGTATNTLTIYDVQQADEGWYYCQVDNDLSGTDPVNSAAGLVMTKRLIIHYPLDTVEGGVTPDVVGGFDMTLMTTGTNLPGQVAGVAQLGEGGNALLFDNRSAADPNSWGQYATAGDVDMEAMGDGLTVAFWAQWVGNNTNWQGLINRRGSWAANNMMWRIDKDPTSGEISFQREGNGSRVATSLTEDTWHYIVATYDIASGTTKMYNNGVRISTATGFTYGTGVNSGFKLGANNDDGTDFFWGMIDDVKVYNYARAAAQVAQDYADIMETSVCDREGTADMQFDTNDDCRIDITDLLEFALDWLNNNRIYPE